jgi:hypothetical protein
MTSRIPKLILVAALAASLPAAAAADDRCDHRAGPGGPAAAPYAYPADPGPRRWREGEWRDRQLHRIDAELRALDAERAELHARWAGRPGRLRRYDRWYAERRAELEHRRAELLGRLAWR